MSNSQHPSEKFNNKVQFVHLAKKKTIPFCMLCSRFGISSSTGYRWLEQFDEQGTDGLKEKSRKPHSSPNQTPPKMEQKVLKLRDQHGWGPRKIRRRLIVLGKNEQEVPAASTITEICRRHGKIDERESRKRMALQRFERPCPNDLWQMDFKGHFHLQNREICYPFTVIDDCSRFLLGLVACREETGAVVKPALTRIFKEFGLPQEILCDNGGPWGNTNVDHGWTALSVWLLHLDVVVIHGAYHHPQTQGKDERFHRSLNEECIQRSIPKTFPQCQRRFNGYRRIYNHERPHEALGLDTPVSHYEVSPRSFPAKLPELYYPVGMTVRKVDTDGRIRWRGEKYRVGRGFRHYHVGLLESQEAGKLEVYFGAYLVGHVNVDAPAGTHDFTSLRVPQKRLLT